MVLEDSGFSLDLLSYFFKDFVICTSFDFKVKGVLKILNPLYLCLHDKRSLSTHGISVSGNGTIVGIGLRCIVS